MLTPRQITALRYLIYRSTNGTELSKRILFLLIEASVNFTQEVCLTLVEDREGFTGTEIHEAALGLGAMQSSNCSTFLDQILIAMGSPFCFSVHYGDFNPSRPKPFNCDGIFEGWPLEIVSSPDMATAGMPMRYTFWLAETSYTDSANLIVADYDRLNAIDITRPGLYPILEPHN